MAVRPAELDEGIVVEIDEVLAQAEGKGELELKISRAALRQVKGQHSGGPIGVPDQSNSRKRRRISPSALCTCPS